jgi:hypothetical protein
MNFFMKNNVVKDTNEINKVKVVYDEGKCYVCKSGKYLKPILTDGSICFCEKCSIKVILFEYIDILTYNELIELKLKFDKKYLIKEENKEYKRNI